MEMLLMKAGAAKWKAVLLELEAELIELCDGTEVDREAHLRLLKVAHKFIWNSHTQWKGFNTLELFAKCSD